jgi:hypothetical protein
MQYKDKYMQNLGKFYGKFLPFIKNHLFLRSYFAPNTGPILTGHVILRHACMPLPATFNEHSN